MTTVLGSEGHAAQGTPTPKERRRALLRLALGTLQIFCTSGSIVLLFQTGTNPWSLSAVAITCAITTISVLLFGNRSRNSPRDRGRGA